MMKYIPQEKKHTLNEFKYTGGTDSITYQYLWSPFAEYLLRFFPMWVAPNLITLSALILLVVVHCIFMLPDPDNIVPNWKLVMMAISILVYQHLDNIDGKQARRTNTSSPLGMLFDHGSDAISAFLISVQVLKILGVSYEFRILTLYLFIMSVYFCAMWSQYSVGYFKLGRVNPVDEGIPAYAIACLIFTQIDTTIFRKYHKIGTYGQEIIYSLMILLFFQIIFMSKDILKNSIRPKKQIIFIPILYFSTGLALYNLITTVKMTEYVYHPLFYALVAMWARNMILIQFQFITKQRYVVFNQGTNCFMIFSVVYILFHSYLPISDFTYFVIMAIIQNIILFEFCIGILTEGAEILQIYIFSTQEKHRKYR